MDQTSVELQKNPVMSFSPLATLSPFLGVKKCRDPHQTRTDRR